jgi:formylglycine-generating enzyme required for sulfatase activity
LRQPFRYFFMRLKFLPLFIIVLGCASQKQFKSAILPPGTVQVNDSLFFDKTEVSNIGWREYLHYLLDLKKDTAAFLKALPDSTVLDKDDPITQYYFAHPGFNTYPVVSVSYEQAIEYCKWRTYAANQALYFKEQNIKDPALHLDETFPIRFIYRLPTKQEWERIASSGIDSSSKVFRKFNKKSLPGYNTKERIDAINKKQASNNLSLSFSPVTAGKSFYPGKYGTYNMTGNVAEMTIEKGIAKGGSFAQSLDSCLYNMEQRYTKPEQWLGFRCVAVLKP